MTDPLHDALREATLAVLLGSTEVPTQFIDTNGNPYQGTISVESAFGARMRERAVKGHFDSLIDQAIAYVDAKALGTALQEAIGKHLLEGLKPVDRYNQDPAAGWFQQAMKALAVNAVDAALSTDESLKEMLRERIGIEVDRNRVGITVSLSDPEK